MKISCDCGNLIVDNTDHLRNKGYVIPDEDWFDLSDELEATALEFMRRIVPAGDNGENTAQAVAAIKDELWHKLTESLWRYSRHVWQCPQCKSLVMDGLRAEDHVVSFKPTDRQAAENILASNRFPNWPGFIIGHSKSEPGRGDLFWKAGREIELIYIDDPNELQRRYYEEFERLRSAGLLRSGYLTHDGEALHSWSKDVAQDP